MVEKVEGKGDPKAAEAEPKVAEVKRTRCEVYSRIVGYLRPVAQWNAGKQAEYKMRKTYEV